VEPIESVDYQLPGVASTTPTTSITVVVFHILIVAVAMGLPCLRAMRLDAVAALRAE
jgi:ABC-type lipoprotein release transport system permease subunit